MMVFLNDRILYDHRRDDQEVVTEIAMGSLGSIHFTTAPMGPADTGQEQLTLDELQQYIADGGRTADSSKQHNRPT